MANKVQIPIDAKVLFEMQEYAGYAKHHFHSEIAGWAHYKQDVGIYKLAPLVEQEVTGATADTTSMTLTNNIKYDISDMIVHWHSHVDMAPNPSGTDLQQIRESMELFPMLISIIVNCKGQYTARLDVKQLGGKLGFRLSSAETYDVELVPYYNNSAISKEVLKKLKKPKPIPIRKAPIVINGKGSEASLFSTKEMSEFEDYLPPRYTPPATEIQKEISKQDTTDAIGVIMELAKCKNVTKTVYNNEEKKLTTILLTGKTTPYTLSAVFNKDEVTFRVNGAELNPITAVQNLLSALEVYGDISKQEKERFEIMLG